MSGWSGRAASMDRDILARLIDALIPTGQSRDNLRRAMRRGAASAAQRGGGHRPFDRGGDAADGDLGQRRDQPRPAHPLAGVPSAGQARPRPESGQPGRLAGAARPVRRAPSSASIRAASCARRPTSARRRRPAASRCWRRCCAPAPSRPRAAPRPRASRPPAPAVRRRRRRSHGTGCCPGTMPQRPVGRCAPGLVVQPAVGLTSAHGRTPSALRGPA